MDWREEISATAPVMLTLPTRADFAGKACIRHRCLWGSETLATRTGVCCVTRATRFHVGSGPRAMRRFAAYARLRTVPT